MISFRNKEEFKEWTLFQLEKYGIKQPDLFDSQELDNYPHNNDSITTEEKNEEIMDQV